METLKTQTQELTLTPVQEIFLIRVKGGKELTYSVSEKREVKIMNSLVKKGLVKISSLDEEEGEISYSLTKEGLKFTQNETTFVGEEEEKVETMIVEKKEIKTTPKTTLVIKKGDCVEHTIEGIEGVLQGIIVKYSSNKEITISYGKDRTNIICKNQIIRVVEDSKSSMDLVV